MNTLEQVTERVSPEVDLTADGLVPRSQGVGLEEVIYTSRFSSAEEETRTATWKVLCRDFFQKFISPTDAVLDIGAGDGHFIRNIQAGRKIALDLSAHVQNLKKFGIEVLQIPATDFATKLGAPVDVIFMSNFLEHLPDKRLLLDILAECRRALKPGGKVIILQPNIRYVGPAYWDYIDHHIALTEHSLKEALEISGFKLQTLIPRFLPYTAKSVTGKIAGQKRAAFMVSMYLKIPLLWRIFGQQTLVVATRPAAK